MSHLLYPLSAEVDVLEAQLQFIQQIGNQQVVRNKVSREQTADEQVLKEDLQSAVAS